MKGVLTMEYIIKDLEYTTFAGGKMEKTKFNMNPDIPMSMRYMFVKDFCTKVIDTLYNAKDEVFHFELLDLMFNYYVVSYFTDIEMADIINTESDSYIDELDNFINGSDIVSVMMNYINVDTIDKLYETVLYNIECKTGVKINKIDKTINSILKTVERAVGKIDIDKLMETSTKLNGISGQLTPKKILEAYSNTDMFKANRDERIKQVKSQTKKQTKTATKTEDKK